MPEMRRRAYQLRIYIGAFPCPDMWNKPTDEELAKMPRLYETESIPMQNRIIHQHYFLGGCDWYMAEYDPNERLFFGYTILNNDYENSEWGYTSLDELASINYRGIEVDRDLYWTPRRTGDIDKYIRGNRRG